MYTQHLNKIFRFLSQGALLTLLLGLCLTTACTDAIEGPDPQQSNERAIDIIASLPDYILTKGGEPKKTFKNGDVIHIEASYSLESGASTQYASAKYNETTGKWEASAANVQLTWPLDAITGDFDAYYIPASEGLANKDEFAVNTSVKINLSEFCKTMRNGYDGKDEGADPLTATYYSVPVGSAVYLQFEHMFAKVTFKHLGEEKYSSASWAAIQNDLPLNLSATAEMDDQITYTRATNTFSHSTAKTTGVITSWVEEENDIHTVSFLVPPITETDNELRLYFDSDILYHIIPVGALKAGKHYVIDVRDLSGVYEEEWNNPGEEDEDKEVELTPKEIGEYLRAVANGLEYSVIRTVDGKEKTVSIIKQYTDGDTRYITQLRDVNFKGANFDPVHPIIDVRFDGNGKKIKELNIQGVAGGYQALFGENKAEIENLIVEVTNYAPVQNGVTHAAVFAGSNQGKLKNIRIKIENPISIVSDATYTGILAAVNTGGEIEDCIVNGEYAFEIELTAKTADSYYVGGLVGANAQGSIRRSYVQHVDNIIYATAETAGSTGAVHAGGLIGYSNTAGEGGHVESLVYGCLTNTQVQTSGDGNINAGGFAGTVFGSAGMNATSYDVVNCIATGQVTNYAEQANIGGFAGKVENGYINASYSTGQITVDQSIEYANINLGGFAGWIGFSGEPTGIMTEIMNCYSKSAIDAAPEPDTVPEGEELKRYGGFVALVSSMESPAIIDVTGEVNITNSFSINSAKLFVGKGEATWDYYHHNGKNMEDADVTLAYLNGQNYGFRWEMKGGYPHLIIEDLNF